MTTDRTSQDLDLEAIRRKYREERDKRVAAGGRGIPDLTGKLAHYLEDPFTPATSRVPIDDEADVVIVGAGLGGLMIAAKLRSAGIEKIRMIDMAGDVGGVWYWNRYPGAMCDVESLIYMPLLEELGYIPKMRYASASEIFQHAQNIAKHYGLYDHALFHTAVEHADWDESTARWVLATDRQDRLRARFLVNAIGPLTRPRLPDIPGLADFRGHAFHASRWDYSYTGGDPDSELDRLGDKVVGIVGTACTALQCVPPVARAAKQLYVFQRTPSTVAVRDNRPIEQELVRSFKPGWQAERRRNFTKILAGAPFDEDLVNDGWTDLYKHIMHPIGFEGVTDRQQEMELADLKRMEQIRARIDSVVTDHATAEALKPWYNYLCKRAGFHDEYLEAFNRPNVTLVDTQGRGLEAMTEDGVVANGVEWKVDCVIFATGFEVDTPYTHRTNFDIRGLRQTLSEKWANGLATLHGLMTSGFPNFFVMPGINSQSVTTTNLVDTMDENATQIAYVIGEIERRGALYFDVDEAAEAEWVETIIECAADRRAFLEACTPGRNNNEGRIDLRPPQNAGFGGGPLEMFAILAGWRARGNLPGLNFANRHAFTGGGQRADSSSR